MAEITPEIIEYATIERLALMLCDVQEPYKVTESYALFTAILCWVIQRIRTPEHQIAQNDVLARDVRQKLERQHIEGAPWEIRAARAGEDFALPHRESFPAFAGMTAFDFLKALRDAVAHGDARAIRPVNQGGFLVGHKFLCKDQQRQPIGSIVLRREDMRRLGCALADLYCETMREAHPDRHVAENAAILQEEVA